MDSHTISRTRNDAAQCAQDAVNACRSAAHKSAQDAVDESRCAAWACASYAISFDPEQTLMIRNQTLRIFNP